MRLDALPDMQSHNDYRFGLIVRNHKCYFHVKGDKHVFGSKLYPVGKRAELFLPDGEPSDQYDHVARAIEASNWQPRNGGCYTHAELLQQTFAQHGIKADYFSGWVFPAAMYPIHHAWVVVDGAVFDIAVNNTSSAYIRQVEQAGENPRDPKHLQAVNDIDANWRPLTDHFTWGNPQMVYVGAKSDPNAARLQYNHAIDVAGAIWKHPSYRHMNKKSRYDASPYQQALLKISGKNNKPGI